MLTNRLSAARVSTQRLAPAGLQKANSFPVPYTQPGAATRRPASIAANPATPNPALHRPAASPLDVHLMRAFQSPERLAAQPMAANAVNTNNTIDAFEGWANAMMVTDVMMRLAAIASVKKRAMLDSGIELPLLMMEQLLNIDTLDFDKVADSTPEVQAYVTFAMVMHKLCKGYDRQAFSRGAFRMLDTLMQKAREDFDTNCNPDAAIAAGNRQKLIKSSFPKENHDARWSTLHRAQRRAMMQQAELNSSHRMDVLEANTHD